MKIVAVAACTSGIAHTYIAKEKLIRAAEALGHEIHVETQGTIGTESKKRMLLFLQLIFRSLVQNVSKTKRLLKLELA